MPAFGAGLLLLKDINTLAGPLNVFVHDDNVFSALISKKGIGRQNIIPGFLPQSVGSLVVLYLSQEVPFVHMAHNQVIVVSSESLLVLIDHAKQMYETSTVNELNQLLASTSAAMSRPSACAHGDSLS